MPTEQLILRRCYPVPVTFADLRRAYDSIATGLYFNGRPILEVATLWHAAIKESTGAVDEVYAVIDGREVRVCTVGIGTGASAWPMYVDGGARVRPETLEALLIKADEAGYWQHPHEVRHVMEESQMSHKTMARISGNSFIVAGAK